MSTAKSLSQQDIQNWLLNLRIFLTPLILIYLLPIVGTLEQQGHIFSTRDFIITSTMSGAMITYILNAGISLLRKYYQGPTN